MNRNQGRYHLMFHRSGIGFILLTLLAMVTAGCSNHSQQVDEQQNNSGVPTITVTQAVAPTLAPTTPPTMVPQSDQSDAAPTEEPVSPLDTVINNGGLYVKYQGGTYYRQYQTDSYEPTGLWAYYNPTVNAVKNMMRLKEDGTVEKAFEDSGEGSIYITGNRMYLQEPTVDYGTKVYSVKCDGSDRKEFGDGSIIDIDESTNTLVCLMKGSGIDINLVAIDGSTGDVNQIGLTVPCAVILGVEDGVIYYRGEVEYDTSQLGVTKLCSVRTDGSEEKLLAQTPDTLYDYLNWGTEIPCFQIVDDTIYFSYGAYAGTGDFYQGGQIAKLQTDGSGFEILAGNITNAANPYSSLVDDTFYVADDNGRRTLYYTSGEMQNTYALDLDSNRVSASDFPVHKHSQTFENEEGVDIYLNASPTMTTLLSGIDYSSLGVDQTSSDNYFTIKDIELCDNWVYYKIEANLYYPDASIGWRDGYKRLKTQVYREELGKDKKELLYEY
jgi:hypothetical protein